MSDQTITTAVHRLAANTEPADLLKRATEALQALLLQHASIVLSLRKDAQGMAQCGCPSCQKEMDDVLGAIASWSGDVNQLEAAENLLRGVNCNFPAPEPELVEATINHIGGKGEDDDDERERVHA
jgi:hypothetical protein